MNVTVKIFPAGLSLLIPMEEVDLDIAILNPNSVICP